MQRAPGRSARRRPPAPSGSADRLAWDDARLLLALLDEGSLSGAAARLGVDTSTASRRLEAVEAALGARLFVRTPAGVLPSPLAERLRPHAEAMRRAATDLALAADGREVLPEGEVRISAPPGVAEHLIAPALPRLLAAFPRLRLAVDASLARADLARREADLALRAVRPSSGDLVARRLGAVDFGIYGAPGYVERLGPLRSLGDARWVTRGDELAGTEPARFVARNVPPGQIALRTSHPGTMTAAAAAGVGLVVIEQLTAAACGLVPAPLAPELRRALSPAPGRGELWLVALRVMREVPRVAAVWELLLAEARRLGLDAAEAGASP